MLGSVEGAYQWGFGARSNGQNAALDQGEDPQGVSGGLIERHISSDRSYRPHIELRRPTGEHERHCIVVTRIYMQDNGLGDHCSMVAKHNPKERQTPTTPRRLGLLPVPPPSSGHDHCSGDQGRERNHFCAREGMCYGVW